MDPEYFCDNLTIKQAEEVKSGLYKNAYKGWFQVLRSKI